MLQVSGQMLLSGNRGFARIKFFDVSYEIAGVQFITVFGVCGNEFSIEAQSEMSVDR